jgi:hypothetical protein
VLSSSDALAFELDVDREAVGALTSVCSYFDCVENKTEFVTSDGFPGTALGLLVVSSVTVPVVLFAVVGFIPCADLIVDALFALYGESKFFTVYFLESKT